MRGILRSVAAAAIVTTVLAAVHPGVRGQPAGLYDEGNTVCAAWRVAEGEVMYRDLWSMHAPGTAHLLALVFSVFGTSLVVERALKVTLVGLLSVLGYALFRRFMGRLGAAMSIALSIGAGFDPRLASTDTALVAIMAALVATLSAIDDGSPPKGLVVAGSLLGVTVWFRHDFGLYATGACSVVVALASWRRPTWDRTAVRRVGRALAALWLGVGVPVVVAVSYFFVRGSLRSMVEQMIIFPATTFAAVRGLPAPALDAVAADLPFGVLFWLTPLTLLAGAAVAGLDARRGTRDAAALLLVCLCGLFVFNYARVRADVVHLWPALVLAIPVMVALGAKAWAARHRRRLIGVGGALTLASIGLFGIVIGGILYRALIPFRPTRLVDAVPARLSTAGIVLEPTLEEALLVLDTHVPAGAPVFVGNRRHDRIFVNCSLCYFLLRRPNPTPYYNLHPGLVTTEAVQREIIRRLEAARVDWILLWDSPQFGDPIERKDPTGATVLDEYLSSRYGGAVRYGRWEVRRRMAAARAGCSASASVGDFGEAQPFREELGQPRVERARPEPKVSRQLGVVQSGVLIHTVKSLRAEEGARPEDRSENASGNPASPQRRVDSETPPAKRPHNRVDELAEGDDGGARDVVGPAVGARIVEHHHDHVDEIVDPDRLQTRGSRPQHGKDQWDPLAEGDELGEV